MKKFITAFVLTAIIAIMLPVAVAAQTYTTTRRVYRNGRWQTVRLTRTRTYNGNHYGWRNNRYRTGTVTPRERRRLSRERARLARYANRTTRDGVITNKEARKLNRKVNRYERRVNKARNN
ncbi:MAG: hypothetical protein M3033_04500 [Acidobacteriota bacterium]|nr:hypothetical protein [Acidobacteriota bacterium]